MTFEIGCHALARLHDLALAGDVVILCWQVPSEDAGAADEVTNRQLGALNGLQELMARCGAPRDAPAASTASAPINEALACFQAAALQLMQINLQCQAEVSGAF